ncbi:M28 family metallopeptidase [Povalibacter sp.]|uniref:M28 family metallopeptidase n=1 Tax=Povalibacter sp. TaxID=1962978 RepID=UPI002F3EFE58
MTRRWRITNWLAAGTVLLTATTAHAAEPWSLVRPEAIRSHVEFLADDLLEGRATASRGYDIAAAYVAAEFRQANLKPAGDGDGFFQTVPLLEATPVLPGSSAELVIDKQTHTFEYGTHYLPSADYLSASSTLTAPLTFAGFGIAAPELDHDDFANVHLAGRIAVIFSGAPAQFPHTQRAYYSSSHAKFEQLIERGAVGVVTIASPQDEKLFPWERQVAMSWTPQMRWLDDAGKPRNAYEQLKLRFRFDQKAAAGFFENAPKDFAETLAAAEAGEAQAFDLPGMLTMSATTGLRRTESANVVAAATGTDLRDEVIVITAHLDHLGRGSAVNSDSIYNGAQDNALGTGILLEMARALHASGVKTRRTLLFAALTAEEKGLLGSDYLAQHPLLAGKTVVANINIDMPMLFAPTLDMVALGEQHSSLGIAARNAATHQGYRLNPDPMPEQVAFVRSDQFSFIRQGVPAIVVMGGYQSRDKRTDVAVMRSEYLEKRYHQPSDDLSGAIDYGTAADLARINLRMAVDVGNATARPRWKNGDFLGRIFVRPGPNGTDKPE